MGGGWRMEGGGGASETLTAVMKVRRGRHAAKEWAGCHLTTNFHSTVSRFHSFPAMVRKATCEANILHTLHLRATSAKQPTPPQHSAGSSVSDVDCLHYTTIGYTGSMLSLCELNEWPEVHLWWLITEYLIQLSPPDIYQIQLMSEKTNINLMLC